MKNLIVYGSKYGSSRKYAERLSELTGIYLADYLDIKDLKAYDNVIYLGGIYAGKVRGLKKTARKLNDKTRLIVVTVSLGDPNLYEHLKEKVVTQNSKLVKKSLRDNLKFFHLVGSIDYPNLKKFDRIVMNFVFKMFLKKDPGNKKILDLYQGKVDELDYSMLDKVVNYLKEIEIIRD